MRRALDLAARGIGQVSPSPLVGCVIVAGTGEIVGEGYYLYERVKHAETIALEQAGDRAAGATAYVSLEPHAHYGRTPPCTDALIKAGVRRVVAPIQDPNPSVSSKGFMHLRRAGVEVDVGLLAHEAIRLNEKYIDFMQTGRPLVHLKLAASLYGRIATRTGDSRWITGEEARTRVHELRHEYDAVLIGARTVRVDDPLLTDRSNRNRRRPLVRVVLDEHLTISPDSQLARTTTDAPVIIFAGKRAEASRVAALQKKGVEVIQNAGGSRDLIALLNCLAERSLQSVLIEGGGQIAGAFLDAKLVDKASFFIAPIIIGGVDATPAVGGTGPATIAEAVHLHDTEIRHHGHDTEIAGYPKSVTSDERQVNPLSDEGAR